MKAIALVLWTVATLMAASFIGTAQTWNTQMVNPGQVLGPQSVLFDNNQNPCVFYYANGYEYFSKWNGATWQSRSIVSGSTGSTYPVVKHDSVFHLVGVLNSQWRHYILNQDGSTFSYFTSPTITSLAVGPLGYLVGASGGNQIYIYRFNLSTNTWGGPELVDGSQTLSNPAIAVASDGTIWVAYYDGYGDNLKVARSNGSGWDVWFVDTAGNVGQFPQITVDASNIAHVTYYDATNGHLKYAVFQP